MENFFDIRKYPLVLLIPALITGILLSLYTSLSSTFALIAAGCLLIIAGLFILRKKNKFPLMLLIVLLFVFIAIIQTDRSLGRETRWKIKDIADSTEQISLTGFVEYYSLYGNLSNRVLLSHAEIIFPNVNVSLGSLQIWVYADSSCFRHVKYGDQVFAIGSLKSASEYGAVSSNLLISCIINRETAVLYSDSSQIRIFPHSGHYARRTVDRVRKFIHNTFSEGLSQDGAALCNALVLGDKSDFNQAFTEKIRLTGLSHIFALSGLNVGLLISLLWLILGLLFIPIHIRLWILLFLTLFYMELGREAPSLVRATLMCSLFLFGRLLQRHGDILNFVAAAACIELLWRPLDLLDVGFQLSYLAVLSILALYNFIGTQIDSFLRFDKRRFTQTIRDVMSGTLASQFGTIPVVGFYFGRIPFLGVFANIIAVPGFAVLLFWSILLLIAKLFSSSLSKIIASSLDFLVYLLNVAVEFFAKIPFSIIHLPNLSAFSISFIYIAILCFGILFYLKQRFWSLPFLIFAINIVIWTAVFSQDELSSKISFIDVGNGDAILISTEDNYNILVDTGPAYKNWSASRRIIPFLSENRIDKLDAIFLTHPDNDHIGGTAGLLNQYPIDIIYFNGDSACSHVFTELLLTENLRMKSMVQLIAGDKIRFGRNMTVTVLYPDSFAKQTYDKSNQHGLVLRIDCGESSVLLTADIDSLNEHDLLSWGSMLDVDLLKVAHHGSGSSSSGAFLKCVSPDISVVTAGKRNIYGHPAKEAIDRLKSLSTPIYITGKEGTVTFEAKNETWQYKISPTRALTKKWNLPYA